jgi:hypothetical protein
LEDYRTDFVDTVESIAELHDGAAAYDQIVWKVEYLARSGHWYNYHGFIKGGQASSVGYDYDVTSGKSRNLDAGTWIFIVLDFDANDGMTAYRGYRRRATDILDEVQAFDPSIPEVLRISAECREKMACGRRVTGVTDLAFVGFKKRMPVGEQRLFAADKSLPSSLWCRNRRFIEALPVLVSPI